MRNFRVLIAAGGTGGHVNPALAVAGQIKKQYPDSEILFVGTADRIESKIVPAAGFPLKTIEISGFKRGFSPDDIKANVKTVVRLLKSSGAVKKIIEEFKPDVAVGFGGYVSGPVIRMAAKMGIPTAIHEQNAYPGVTNKALAEKVDTVMLTAKEALKHMKVDESKCIVTGLPIRGELLEADGRISRMELGFNSKPIILCMGGSLGAGPINKAICDVLVSHMYDDDYNYIVSTGQNGLWVPQKLADNGIDLEKAENIRIRPYIDDMARCLSAADLVICRAGASSLSEIQALGKPSILIPSPNVTENHQYHNAMALVNNGAAVIIEEKDLDGNKLNREINNLLRDKKKLEEVKKKAKEMAVIDAAEQIAHTVLALVK